jgi:hypothetical protein
MLKQTNKVYTNIPGNEHLLSFIETLGSQIYTWKYNILKQHLQYILNLITVEFLLFVKSQFTTDPNIIHLIISRMNTSDRGMLPHYEGPGEVGSGLIGINPLMPNDL